MYYSESLDPIHTQSIEVGSRWPRRTHQESFKGRFVNAAFHATEMALTNTMHGQYGDFEDVPPLTILVTYPSAAG